MSTNNNTAAAVLPYYSGNIALDCPPSPAGEWVDDVFYTPDGGQWTFDPTEGDPRVDGTDVHYLLPLDPRVKVLLNIGLLTNDTKQELPLSLVWPIIEALFHTPDGGSNRYRIAPSETEETLVVEVDAVICELQRKLTLACFWLHQDCIAVQLPDGSGELVGPAPENFGWVFDPKQFLPLDWTDERREGWLE